MSDRNISLEVATNLAWVYNEAYDAAKESLRSLANAQRLDRLGFELGETALTDLENSSQMAKASLSHISAAVPNFHEDVELPTNEVATSHETTLENTISAFLNPELKIGANEQLDTMGAFWDKLGLAMPELSEEQEASLERAVEANPHKRIMPTPLVPRLLEARKQMTETARRVFPEQQFTDNRELTALWTPDAEWTYAKALVYPEGIIKDGSNRAKLGYKTAEGNIVGRVEYLESLVTSGDAIEAEDGTIWVFPILDAQVRSPRDRQRADEHLKQISHVETPESLIAMQLLHQANGTPNPEWEVDFANEAIYLTNKKGEFILDEDDNPIVLQVVGMGWYPDIRRVYLCRWYADYAGDEFGRRGAESVL